MADAQQVQDVICVHCRKPFHAEVLSPRSEHAGVKCPHCRLFMPLERVDTDANEAA
jgi:hypothetical protein